MLQCEGIRDPYLYTYYAMASVIVIVLAITLIWWPFVQLITEANTVIAKLVIYFNTELLGFTNKNFSNALETVFLSEESLACIAVFCISFALYLASDDLLQFAGCYVANLPNTNSFRKIKQTALHIINDLLGKSSSRRGSKYRSGFERKRVR